MTDSPRVSTYTLLEAFQAVGRCIFRAEWREDVIRARALPWADDLIAFLESGPSSSCTEKEIFDRLYLPMTLDEVLSLPDPSSSDYAEEYERWEMYSRTRKKLLVGVQCGHVRVWLGTADGRSHNIDATDRDSEDRFRFSFDLKTNVGRYSPDLSGTITVHRVGLDQFLRTFGCEDAIVLDEGKVPIHGSYAQQLALPIAALWKRWAHETRELETEDQLKELLVDAVIHGEFDPLPEAQRHHAVFWADGTPAVSDAVVFHLEDPNAGDKIRAAITRSLYFTSAAVEALCKDRGMKVPSFVSTLERGGAQAADAEPLPSQQAAEQVISKDGLNQNARRKGGKRPKYNKALQEVIGLVRQQLIDDGEKPTLSTLTDWFRQNASAGNPYSFEPPIPDCDDLYVDGEYLVWKDRTGRDTELKLRSLDRYLRRANNPDKV